ncbi:MAG: polysaccharide deacetylase family protein [Bacteroidota bacterium]
MRYFHKTPFWLKAFYPSLKWDIPSQKKEIFLTFDDGPIPEVTPWVLDKLDRVGAKATFFCVGDNVRKHPGVLKEVSEQGHTIGNHTFHHVNGWNYSLEEYLSEIEQCQSEIEKNGITTKLFRPPHGRIRKQQVKAIQKTYDIIMWSHLSGDFDAKVDRVASMKVMKVAGPGSVFVFHDSLKAEKNLREMLPQVLDHFLNSGFKFKSL